MLHKNFKESIGLLLEVKRVILLDEGQKAELLTSCNALPFCQETLDQKELEGLS